MSADLLGRDFQIGDKVARGVSFNAGSAGVRISTVTGFGTNGKPILDGARNPVRNPDWLLIVNEVFSAHKTG